MRKSPKIGDTSAVVSGNRVCISLQNNLKIILQIPAQLFKQSQWYLPTIFEF